MITQPTTLLSAVPVPFDANGDLDVKGQETLLRHLKDTGIGGVFIAGTTGEFTALDDDERAVVLSVGARGVRGGCRVHHTSVPLRPDRPKDLPPRRLRSARGTWPRSPRSTCRPVPRH